ncbi:MAG: transcription antitermination factor NusB [Gemmatimonadetes bacterium]|nr:transcription antitermination factor NusB [Gemmatimonadota bacterium]
MSEARLDALERLDRSRARAWILQIHYRWESEGARGTLAEALRATMATRRVSPRRLPYVRLVIGLLEQHLGQVDDALRSALDNWRLERLSAMDRGVLRVGATEILFVEDVPPKVAIQEAIRLAEAYGGDESPRFVNGVLDALYKGTAAR